MKPFSLAAAVLLAFTSAATHAQSTGIAGQWREPGGSVIRVAPCGANLCATLIAISTSAPSKVDGKNPDQARRTRPLCGLQIGTGFHPAGGNKAEGGMLYDPKSGKTYHGTMSAEGDTLSLRGYVGVKAFGRTEKWTRTSGTPACTR